MATKKLSVPHDVYFTLTSKCNLRCIHCFGRYGDGQYGDELSGDDWDKIIKDLVQNDVFFVNISGGEPTIHKDFKKIMASLTEHGMHFALTTNGLCGHDILESIDKEYCLGIKVSLDGPDAMSHAYIRRGINGGQDRETFHKVIQTIKYFKENGFNYNIATCLHSKNVHKIGQMIPLIKKLRPSGWSISTISNTGRAEDNSDIFVSESLLPMEFWHSLKAECEDAGISVKFVDMPNLIKSDEHRNVYFSCPAARWFCEINSDGLTTPCPLAKMKISPSILKFDNIKDMSIKQIWDGEAFRTFRKWQHSGCDGCVASGECDRCVPQSIEWYDDPLKPPPYCVVNGEPLELKNLESLKKELNMAMKKTNRDNYIIEAHNGKICSK